MAANQFYNNQQLAENSNFYLCDSNNTTNGPADSSQVRYNSATQKLASMVYLVSISHLTRDTIDIEVFYFQITQLNDVYLQDQKSKLLTYDSISTPVTVIESGGTGETSANTGGTIIISHVSATRI